MHTAGGDNFGLGLGTFVHIQDGAIENSGLSPFTLSALTTGSDNDCSGAFSCNDLVTGNGNSGHGAHSGRSLAGASSNNTTDGFSALLHATDVSGMLSQGAFSCSNLLTSPAGSTCLGFNVAPSLVGGNGHNIFIGTSSATDAVDPNVDHELNLGGIVRYSTRSLAAPVVSGCGTSPVVAANSNAKAGTVTVGTGTPAACAITFPLGAYNFYNKCRVTPHSTTAGFGYNYSLAAINLVATSMPGLVVDYDCEGV